VLVAFANPAIAFDRDHVGGKYARSSNTGRSRSCPIVVGEIRARNRLPKSHSFREFRGEGESLTDLLALAALALAAVL